MTTGFCIVERYDCCYKPMIKHYRIMKHLLRNFLAALTLIILMPAIGNASITACPDTASALTPATLQESWAVEWWMPRHEKKLTEDGREDAKLLFLGDSITHGWEDTGKDTWLNYYADYGAFNIGFSGDRTENVLWRLQHGEVDGIEPELAILMIGTNNTGHRQDSPECTTRGIEMIIGELKQRLPDTRILLLAIFPREASPEGELRQLNNRINEQIANLTDEDRVYFLDLNHAFLDDEGVLSEDIMPDLLHPNEYGYKLWAEEMEPAIQELMNE